MLLAAPCFPGSPATQRDCNAAANRSQPRLRQSHAARPCGEPAPASGCVAARAGSGKLLQWCPLRHSVAGQIAGRRGSLIAMTATSASRHYPDFPTVSATGRRGPAGARLSPPGRATRSRRSAPFTRSTPAAAPACSRAWWAARRSAATASWPPSPSSRSRPTATRVTTNAHSGRFGLRHADAGDAAVRVRQSAWRSCGGGSRRSGRSGCPSCRIFAAGPSAMPATTRSATSSGCPIRRRTTATCPTWPSPSTTRWWYSTTCRR